MLLRRRTRRRSERHSQGSQGLLASLFFLCSAGRSGRLGSLGRLGRPRSASTCVCMCVLLAEMLDPLRRHARSLAESGRLTPTKRFLILNCSHWGSDWGRLCPDGHYEMHYIGCKWSWIRQCKDNRTAQPKGIDLSDCSLYISSNLITWVTSWPHRGPLCSTQA